MTAAFTLLPTDDADRAALTDARELAGAMDAESLRAYLARKGDNPDSVNAHSVALGRAQAIIGFLLDLGGADLLFPVPAEYPNPYEQAAARFNHASQAHPLLTARARIAVRLAEQEYDEASAELRKYESQPGIPLPEYR